MAAFLDPVERVRCGQMTCDTFPRLPRVAALVVSGRLGWQADPPRPASRTLPLSPTRPQKPAELAKPAGWRTCRRCTTGPNPKLPEPWQGRSYRQNGSDDT